MKNGNNCPKCGGNDIIKAVPTAVGAGNDIRVGVFAAVPVQKYLCGKCGFTEEWIDNAEDIERVRRYAAK
jgi:ribosomal protein S27AE